jgi:hypothetical protein
MRRAQLVESFSTIPWFAWIAIVAIVGGVVSGVITKLTKTLCVHRERMAMIRMGMHPDAHQQVAPDPSEKPACFEEV